MTQPWYSVILRPLSAARNFFAGKSALAKTTGKRMYKGAQVDRLTGDWNALGTSADSEILTSLRMLRARSRQLVRDNEYAKNVVRILKTNVVGTGIGFEPQVKNRQGKLNVKLNAQIKETYQQWTKKDSCHTAGLLCMEDIQSLVVGQLVEAGEVLIRMVNQKFGESEIPFALEIIESDRLMDQWQTARAPNGNVIRMGVESDTWGRPVAYWLYPTHPGDYQFTSFVPSNFIRVPAEEIIHIYIIERWPQTRGVPWFHCTLTRLHNMDGYEHAEIVAARASANIVGFVKSLEAPLPAADEGDGTQARVMDIEPGTFHTLLPGEDFVGFNPTRPNAALEPFMRYMLRSLSAGIGLSYASLSHDYSQSNYSSSRLAALSERDMYRVIQGFVCRNMMMAIYERWLPMAVLAGVVNISDFFSNKNQYLKHRWRPRGWAWVDPTKEVNAYRTAVRCGFMSVTDVISQTAGGADAEEVFAARREELDVMADLDLVFDTDPSQVNEKGIAQPVPAAPEDDTGTTDNDDPQANASGDDQND